MSKLIWKTMRAVGEATRMCPAKEDLFEYAMYGLADDERDKIRRHLEICPACREQIIEYALVTEGLALEADQVEVPESMLAGVMARLKQEPQTLMHPLVLKQDFNIWNRMWIKTGPAFALASMVMALVLLQGIPTGPQLSNQEAQALVAMATQLGSSASLKKVSLMPVNQSDTCRGEILVADGDEHFIINVDLLQPCRHGRTYTVWMETPDQPKPIRMAGFQVEDTGHNSFLLKMPHEFKSGQKPFKLKVTLEHSAHGEITRDDQDLRSMRGKPYLEGVYDL